MTLTAAWLAAIAAAALVRCSAEVHPSDTASARTTANSSNAKVDTVTSVDELPTRPGAAGGTAPLPGDPVEELGEPQADELIGDDTSPNDDGGAVADDDEASAPPADPVSEPAVELVPDPNMMLGLPEVEPAPEPAPAPAPVVEVSPEPAPPAPAPAAAPEPVPEPTPTPPPAIIETSTVTNDPNVFAYLEPATPEEALVCAQALNADVTNVVSITGSQTVVSTSSIVAVSLGGSASFIMEAAIKIAGFCLFQKGGSQATFSASFMFERLGVFSSGNPAATFLLADGAGLTQFAATAGGNSSIGIYSPQNLDCTRLLQNAVVNGNPTVSCGTQPP